MRSASLPLAASIAGHAAGLTALVLLAAQLQPLPLPQPKPVEIALAVLQPPPIPEPMPAAETPPPEPEPPPVAEAEPPPIPEPEPPPPAAVAEPPPPPPPPPPKRVVVHKPPPPPRPPRVVREMPPEPVYRRPEPIYRPPEPIYRPPVMPTIQQPPMPAMPQRTPMQTAAMPMPQPQRPAAPTGPVVSAGYRAALSTWLEGHKHYPDSARARGEEGRAVLRFRVDRSGRVLNYSLAQSTGYPDLDAAIDSMMRGASLPPFPSDMTATDIDVSVTVRFGLAR